MTGEEFVVGETAAQSGVGGGGWGLHAGEGGGESGPGFAAHEGEVVPFRQVRHAGDGFGDGAAEMPGEKAGGERPDRLEAGQGGGAVGGGDVVGVDHLAAVVEFAGDQELAADGEFIGGKALEIQ